MTGLPQGLREGDVHVAAGDSSAGTLRIAGLPPESLVVVQDDLTWGRLIGVGDPAGWQAARKPWMASHDTDLGDLGARAERSRVLLWLGGVAQEQVLIAWVVAAFEHYGWRTDSLHVLREWPRGSWGPFQTVGAMPPDRVRQCRAWQPLRGGDVHGALRLWDAVTDEMPAALEALLHRPGGLSAPQRATARAFLERYPHPRDGLSKWSRRVLEAVRDHGPMAAMVVGRAMIGGMDAGDADWVGDQILFPRLLEMGSSTLAKPLCRLRGSTSAMRYCSATLTTEGSALLRGEGNNLAWNGIDEWVGGVHLDGRAGTVWTFDGERVARWAERR